MMRILSQIKFELGGFIVLGCICAIVLHFTPIPHAIQVMLLLVFSGTATLWLIGRVKFLSKLKITRE